MTVSVKRKVVLLGDGGVGKTSLIRRFVLNTFDDKYLVTIGTKVSKKVVKVPRPAKGDEAEVMMAIWDIMGHMGVTSVQTDYMHGAAGALVVADVGRRATLDSTIRWVEAVRKVSPDVHVVLLANKADLIGQTDIGVNLWEFGEGELDDFSREHGFTAYLTSAKTGGNVGEAFQEMAAFLLDGR